MNIFKKFLLLLIVVSFLSPAFLTGQGIMKKSHGTTAIKKNRLGKVIETMDSGGYTYVHIEEKGNKFWGAGKAFPIKTGDNVEFKGGMEMTNFTSKTLKRTFKKITFFTFIRKEGTDTLPPKVQSMLPKGHRPIGKNMNNKGQDKKQSIIVKAGSIKKAKDGLTIEECYKNKKSLNGKKVTVRGIVVKFSKNIMGKNWIHIQDGSGKKGTNDLTVTTKGIAVPGDQILAEGVLAANKDFGSGYKYSVILEKTELKVEKRGKK